MRQYKKMGSCLCFAAFFLFCPCACARNFRSGFSPSSCLNLCKLSNGKSRIQKWHWVCCNKSLELSSWQRCDSIAVHVVNGDNFVRLIRQKRWRERESPNQNRIDDKMFKIEFTGFLLHFYVWFYASFIPVLWLYFVFIAI